MSSCRSPPSARITARRFRLAADTSASVVLREVGDQVSADRVAGRSAPVGIEHRSNVCRANAKCGQFREKGVRDASSGFEIQGAQVELNKLLSQQGCSHRRPCLSIQPGLQVGFRNSAKATLDPRPAVKVRVLLLSRALLRETIPPISPPAPRSLGGPLARPPTRFANASSSFPVRNQTTGAPPRRASTSRGCSIVW